MARLVSLLVGGAAAVLVLYPIFFLLQASLSVGDPQARPVASDQAEKSGTQLALCGVVGQVRELFEMGGLLQAFAIHDSREDACTKLG